MRITQTLILLICFCFSGIAQESTLIHGKVFSTEKESIFFTFHPSHLKLEKATLAFDINDDGEFKADLIIEEAQVVKFELNHEPLYLFIKPGEKVGLLIEQINFVSTVKYFEKNEVADNLVYDKYNSIFDQQEVVYSSNISTSKKLLGQLADLSSADKFNLLKEQYKAEMEFFTRSKEKNLSDSFSHFLESEIRFKFLGRLILYVKKEELAPALEKEFSELISAGYKGQETNNSIHYNAYLNVYSKFICKKNPDDELDYFKDFSKRYNRISQSDQIDQRSKEKVLAWLIYYNIRPKKVRELSTLLDHYRSFTKDETLLAKIDQRFALASSLRDGQVAPDFTMVDKNGTQINLKDFREKKVHISVWAKWCGLCKEGIVKSEENRKQLESEAIAFIFISIDEEIEKWQSHTVTKEQSGVHLWGGDLADNFTNDYGIISLPRTYLIDEEGKFITDFPAYDSKEFIDFIKND